MSNLVDQYGKKVEKVILQQSNEFQYGAHPGNKNRGVTVYSTSQLQQITGRDKEGRLITWGVEQPYFYISIQQRVEIFRLCSPIFGVVTSRMNRLSGLDFSVVSEKKMEDKTVMEMKNLRLLYEEYDNEADLGHMIVRSRVFNMLIEELPDLKPDLSNFDGALLRWKRKLRAQTQDACDEAKSWLQEPNNGLTWEEFVKKWVFDILIHGSVSIYKDVEHGRLTNFDVLPGGSTYRIKTDYFSNVDGYVQILPAYPGFTAYMEPQIYFGDELSYSEYAPTSSRSYGFIPLEALINKIAETLYFDELMANQADGTK